MTASAIRPRLSRSQRPGPRNVAVLALWRVTGLGRGWGVVDLTHRAPDRHRPEGYAPVFMARFEGELGNARTNGFGSLRAAVDYLKRCAVEYAERTESLSR